MGTGLPAQPLGAGPGIPVGRRAWGRGASRDSRVAAVVRPLAVSAENSCCDLTRGGSDPQTQLCASLVQGTPLLINVVAVKVTLPAGRGAWVGEGVVAGEDTKMTALAQRRASCLFSLPSPQVRLASLQSEA